jgi:hypothetical protein
MDQPEPRIPPITDADQTEVASALARQRPPAVEVHHDPEGAEGPEALRFNAEGVETILRPTADGRWSWVVDPHPGRQRGTYDDPLGGGDGTEDTIEEAVARALKYPVKLRP